MTIIVFVRRVGAGKAGGVDSGGTVKGVDFQAAVVCQYPALQVLGLLDCFECSIGGKRIAVLDDFNCPWHLIKRDHAKAPWREHFRELDPLLAIVGADDEVRDRSERFHPLQDTGCQALVARHLPRVVQPICYRLE